jgi:hypothetical protein
MNWKRGLHAWSNATAKMAQEAFAGNLPLVLLVLAVIYVLALIIMVRVVSQPAIGQKLRLDEA